MDRFIFKELVKNPQDFFQILPQEWQDEIVPFWEDYKADAKIYTLERYAAIIGGGIVFYKVPPNFEYFKNEAQEWFHEGYLYLGFIWVDAEHRNKNLGTFWLHQLKDQNIQQNYFLLTEEAHLHRFYIKNGFVCEKSLQNEDHEEWLYITKNNSDVL